MNRFFGMLKDNIFICNNCNAYAYKKNCYKISYDGNIHSLVMIKKELLAKGYYFETSLEEEIILKAFIEYGTDVYSKFSGHFSIAIWNENKNELTLMKDLYSVKSVYYKILDDGWMIFSNELVSVLFYGKNTIKYDRFIKTYLINLELEEELITEDILEITPIIIFSNKLITKTKKINYQENSCIFDEVAQIVISNLDNICIAKLEYSNSQIYSIAKYILEMLNKEKIILNGRYSDGKLDFFLTNMELPFYNIAEYSINFISGRPKQICLVDSAKKDINRFYNISCYEKVFNMRFAFPNFAKKGILNLEENYETSSEKINNYINKKVVLNRFEKMLMQTHLPINELNDCNYYRMLYLIRLDNWIKKYNIKII